MVDKRVKNRVGQGCIFHVIIFCSLYFLLNILLVKLKDIHTSACLKLNYGTTKQKPKMVEFIKTCGQYPRRFIFGIFFYSIILSPPFLLGKNRSSVNAVQKEWVNSFCLGGNDKNLRESFA